jgi:hypothetical protein
MDLQEDLCTSSPFNQEWEPSAIKNKLQLTLSLWACVNLDSRPITLGDYLPMCCAFHQLYMLSCMT